MPPYGGAVRNGRIYGRGTMDDKGPAAAALSDEVSGKLTMNLGVIQGDENSLSVKINYRCPVTRSFDGCAPQVRSAFEAAGFRRISGGHGKSLYMAPDSPLVTKLMEVYRDYTGDREAKPKSIGGGTYAKSMPNTVAFGPIFPGDEVREHKPDELMAAAMYALAK